jgi:hypothetical protein
MKSLIAAVIVCLGAAAPAAAAWPADTITSRYGLAIPSTGTPGYALKINDWATKLDTMTASQFKFNDFWKGDYFHDQVTYSSSTTNLSTSTITGQDTSGNSLSLTGGMTAWMANLSHGLTSSTGAFSGAVSAGSFSGPLTGNVTGNVTGTATSIAGGAAGQVLVQSGAGVTGFQAGISSTCASGFHLSTTTVVNGIITGGGCIADGSGGGLSSLLVASGTVVGSSTGTSVSGQQSVSSLYLDSAGLDFTVNGSSGIIKVKNLTFVASTTTYPSGTTTASTLGTCVGTSAVWNQGNNKTQFCYAGSARTGSANAASAGIVLDGALLQGFEKGIECSPTTNGVNCSFCTDSPVALSPGQHTACLTAAVSAGTLTIPASDSLGSSSVLVVAERATGGSGYSAPASSFTVVGPGTYTTTIYAVAVATVTRDITSGVIDIWGVGTMSSNNTINGLGILVDGMYISTATGETAYGQPTVLGTVSENKGIGVVASVEPSGGTDMNMSFPPVRVTGLSPGSHSVALTVKTNGTVTNPSASGNSKYTFGFSEVRNAAGTGDVSSNGNINFSGAINFQTAPTFSGALPFAVPIASGVFTNVTTASVTIPSGYSSYFVTGRLQNTNASARTAVLTLGGDFGSNYGWALLNDYVASTEHVGCDPSKWVGMTDSTSGTNRLAASAWLSFSCTVDVASASVMLWNCTATASNNDVSQMNHLTFGGIYRGSASVAGFSMSSGLSTCTTVPVPSASSVSGTIRVFGLP